MDLSIDTDQRKMDANRRVFYVAVGAIQGLLLYGLIEIGARRPYTYLIGSRMLA